MCVSVCARKMFFFLLPSGRFADESTLEGVLSQSGVVVFWRLCPRHRTDLTEMGTDAEKKKRGAGPKKQVTWWHHARLVGLEVPLFRERYGALQL